MHKVLLVEPDASVARICKRKLQENNFTVLVVRTAQDAIAQLGTADLDVIVLELQLGGHGGVEFLYEVRSYADLQQIPIVLYTGLPKEVIDTYGPVLKLLNVRFYMNKLTSSLDDLVAKILSAVHI